MPFFWPFVAAAKLVEAGEALAVRNLKLADISCPVYLLAGAADDITTSEQVFGARALLGTPDDKIVDQLVPGGHIGLFVGARTRREHWPEIGRWIAATGS